MMKIPNHRWKIFYGGVLLFLLQGASPLQAQQTEYVVKLVDAETRRPVRNATVKVAGTTGEIISNVVGYFQVAGESPEIEITHIGYHALTVRLSPENPKLLIPMSTLSYRLDTLDLRMPIEPFAYRVEYVKQETISRAQPYTQTEMLPDFPGGTKQFHNYLSNGLIDAPDAISKGVDVDVHFSILEDGAIRVDTIIDRSESRVDLRTLFNNAPHWVPGFQQHVPVVTHFQQTIAIPAGRELWYMVENPAQFEGGLPAFYEFITVRLQYPKEARQQGLSGKVFVQFVVNVEGKLEDIEVLKSAGYELDREAIRVVKLSSGKWTPGNFKGKPVRQKMVLPITFNSH